MKNKTSGYHVAAVSLAMLGIMGLGTLNRPSLADARPYHQRVMQAINTLPMQLGSWIGTDVEVLSLELDILKPNALLHRIYRNVDTGETATLLIVHCNDARDLAGHYPPICYPAHGWQLRHQTAKTWNCEGLTVQGTEYQFSYGTIGGSNRMNVANFMLLPDGRTTSDMSQVYQLASNYQRRFYGAAQMQVVIDARLPEQQRDRILEELVGANAEVLKIILSGETQ